MRNLNPVLMHLITALIAIAISVLVTSHMALGVVKINPKSLIDSYTTELNNSDLSVEKQAEKLVRFTQVMESMINSYADDNNVVVIVDAAIATDEKDITNDIAQRIVEHYKSHTYRLGGE